MAPIPADLRDILLPIFRDLHTLAGMAPDLGAPTTTFGTRYMAFTQMRVSVDHRAFDLPMAPENQGKHYSSTLIACCMSTLAFTHLTIRDFQPTFCNGKKLLFAQFDSFNLDFYPSPEDNRALLLLRLWALCVSAATALDEQELQWYTVRIIILMDDLELVTSKEVENELGKYIWMSVNSATFLNTTWPELKNVPAPTEA